VVPFPPRNQQLAFNSIGGPEVSRPLPRVRHFATPPRRSAHEPDTPLADRATFCKCSPPTERHLGLPMFLIGRPCVRMRPRFLSARVETARPRRRCVLLRGRPARRALPCPPTGPSHPRRIAAQVFSPRFDGGFRTRPQGVGSPPPPSRMPLALSKLVIRKLSTVHPPCPFPLAAGQGQGLFPRQPTSTPRTCPGDSSLSLCAEADVGRLPFARGFHRLVGDGPPPKKVSGGAQPGPQQVINYSSMNDLFPSRFLAARPRKGSVGQEPARPWIMAGGPCRSPQVEPRSRAEAWPLCFERHRATTRPDGGGPAPTWQRRTRGSSFWPVLREQSGRGPVGLRGPAGAKPASPPVELLWRVAQQSIDEAQAQTLLCKQRCVR